MALESLTSSDRRVVFRETFNSESDTIKNGGILSNITYVNHAASFNGSNSKIMTKSNTNYTNFSVRVRIFIRSTGNYEAIISKREANIPWSWALKVDDTVAGRKLSFAIFDVPEKQIKSDLAVTLNKWIEVVGTYDGSTIRLYVDGVQQGSGTSVLTITKTPDFIVFGLQTAATYYFDGLIEFGEIYDVALTSDEVLSLYQNNLYIEPDLLSETVLDIDPNRGNFNDKMGNTVSNTDVTLIKDSKYVGRYNGTTSVLDLGNVGNIYSISAWVYYNGTNQSIITVDGGTNNITISSNTLAYYGDNMYVNGIDTNTISKGWNHIVMVDTSGISASNLNIGKVGAIYFLGKIGRISIYSKNISTKEITRLYNSQKNQYISR